MESEIIIIGAGPAGSTLAYELAQEGRGVLLLDKAKFPRPKCCAGGLNLRTWRLLPFDLHPIAEKFITGINFTHRLTSSSLRRHPEPFLVTIQRENFDHFLVKQAQQKGVFFKEETYFFSLYQDDRYVEVETSSGKWRAKFLIGADGAHSQVAKKLGLNKEITHILVMHSEIPSSQFPEQSSDFIYIDWGSLPRSYAYLFPKKKFWALGAGGYRISAREIKKYQRAFFASRWGKEENPPFRPAGSLLPLRNYRRPIHKGRCLLIGDAAGLIDPFTGEGIYSAIRSAQICAPFLGEGLKRNWSSLQPCQEAIDSYLMPELECARLFREVFNLSPSFFHWKVTTNERWWQAMVKVLRGEKSFLDIKRKLGPLGTLLLKLAK